MDIRFLDVAQEEFDEAVEYYNAQAPGLGDEFLLEVLSTLERVRQFPNASQRACEAGGSIEPGVSEANPRNRCPNDLRGRVAGERGMGISVARYAGSRFLWERDPRVALALLAHPGLNSAARYAGLLKDELSGRVARSILTHSRPRAVLYRRPPSRSGYCTVLPT
jgi:hypothetical protein